MPSKDNARSSNGTRWRSVKARLRAQGRPCWICRAFGRPDAIDYSLPPLDPGSFEADHLIPVSKGGPLYDMANLDATHRACNIWKRDRSVSEVLAIARRERQQHDGHVSVCVTTDW